MNHRFAASGVFPLYVSLSIFIQVLIRHYSSELRFLFSYYPVLAPEEISANHVCKYIIYLRDVHHSGYSKIRILAFSVKYLFTCIHQKPYELPSSLYPRKEFKLPQVMSPEEVARLLDVTKNLKSRTILETWYSTGMRCDELRHLQINDIDSANMRIKVRVGKGRRQRFVLLSPRVLKLLREYY